MLSLIHIFASMSNKDNIAIEISTADINLTSEMDVQPTQTSPIDEADTSVSVVYLSLIHI